MNHDSRPRLSTESPTGVIFPPCTAEHVVVQLPKMAVCAQSVYAFGRFAISSVIVNTLVPHLHRSLAVCAVLQAGALHRTCCPYAEVVLFPDDIKIIADLHVGYFQVDLHAVLGLEYPGTWWITVGVGPVIGSPTPINIC